MISNGIDMDGMEDFQERNFFQTLNKSLTSQSCGRLFGSIQSQKIQSFFKLWVKKALKDKAICYEITSVSSYYKNITNVEHGYSYDYDEVPQFNMGIFLSNDSKLPIYYSTYNGSLIDKTNLSLVLKNAKTFGIKNVTLILDAGSPSDESFKRLNKSCNEFTIGIPVNSDLSKKRIKEQIDSIPDYANKFPKERTFCGEELLSINGVKGKLLFYFDQHNCAQLCSELSDRIEQLKAELSVLKPCTIKQFEKFDKFFIFQKLNNKSGFEIVVNDDAVDKLKKSKGCFFLFTTDIEADPQDLLHFYRAKDKDEKLLDQIMLDMGDKYVRTHDILASEGKLFLTFIVFAIRAYMQNKLGKYRATDSLSLGNALDSMENILVVHSDGEWRFAKALTKRQKEILTSFDAVADIGMRLESLKGI
jgi:transposase